MNTPAISLAKIKDEAPGLVDLYKKAGVSLDKKGLTGQRAAVYLVLDHSGSMSGYYRNGSVQRLAEQALGLSANLDDDGIVPIIYFGSDAEKPIEADLASYQGIVDNTHRRIQWGSTNYVAAMKAVVDDYLEGDPACPAFVIFQTDGEPDDRKAVERELQAVSRLPIFWAFVGFGGRVSFLEKLDDLKHRAIDNASFFHAADPHKVSDSDLYDALMTEYPTWLAEARTAGITR